MIDYLRSEALKKYLADCHIELDDKLKYSLIVNARAPQEEKIISLKELAASSVDEEIRTQVPVWIRNAGKEYEILSRNSGPSYCYKVICYDRYYKNDQLYGCFGALELAVKAGIAAALENEADEFDVEKAYMPSSEEDQQRYDADETNEAYDEAEGRYRVDGKLLFSWAHKAVVEEIEDPLEERYYIIPHPFRKGDIVKEMKPEDSNRVYIVIDDEDDDMNVQKQKINHGDWSDVGICTEMIDLKTGLIWDVDSPVCPMDLEYYSIDDHTKDTGERVLLNLSNLYKGKPASLQYIQNGLMRLREKYDESQTYNLLYGNVLKKSTMEHVFD